MKIFAATDHSERFIDAIVRANGIEVTRGKAKIQRFSNGEMHINVPDNVAGEICVVVGSIAPPDEQLLATLMLVDVLVRDGAEHVYVYMPYLAYGRQDKLSPGEGGGIALMGALLKAVGAAQVITYDVHSDDDIDILGIPLSSLSPASLFAEAIAKLGWEDMTIVAPDEGAVGRSTEVSLALGTHTPVAYCINERVGGAPRLQLIGDVGKRVVIVDDVLDTGRTLLSVCALLQNKGVRDIAVAVTHGLFRGDGWKELFAHGVRIIFVTDSCPDALHVSHEDIHVLELGNEAKKVLSIVEEKEYRDDFE